MGPSQSGLESGILILFLLFLLGGSGRGMVKEFPGVSLGVIGSTTAVLVDSGELGM